MIKIMYGLYIFVFYLKFYIKYVESIDLSLYIFEIKFKLIFILQFKYLVFN